mmetsp:Transcript_22409/g.52846  ORF Transcript_22409/g.52846 Transcript_22409/m.52846 type:complete len:374 (+) Transcript_22409:694-1815(+)
MPKAVQTPQDDSQHLQVGAAQHASVREGRHGPHGPGAPEKGRPLAVDATRRGPRGAEGGAGAVEGLDRQDQGDADGEGRVRVHRGGQGADHGGLPRASLRAVGRGHGAPAEPPDHPRRAARLPRGRARRGAQRREELHRAGHQQRHPRGEQLPLHDPRHDARTRRGLLGVGRRRLVGERRGREHPEPAEDQPGEARAPRRQDPQDEGDGGPGRHRGRRGGGRGRPARGDEGHNERRRRGVRGEEDQHVEQQARPVGPDVRGVAALPDHGLARRAEPARRDEGKERDGGADPRGHVPPAHRGDVRHGPVGRGRGQVLQRGGPADLEAGAKVALPPEAVGRRHLEGRPGGGRRSEGEARADTRGRGRPGGRVHRA